MISDSERREVARKIRELPNSATWTADRIGEALLHLLVYGDGRKSLNLLADLIEPESERTCRVEASHEVEGDGCYSYFEYELSCGHEIAWGDQLPPSYCPECGRRVLYDSDDYI